MKGRSSRMKKKPCSKRLKDWLIYTNWIRIVHRDIKPTNILIFLSKVSCEPQPQIKLADFGLSKRLTFIKKDFTNTSTTNPSGTIGWMAPEVYQSESYDFKVDIWALGLIFGYTLSGGKHPFGHDPDERQRRIKKQKEIMLQIQEHLKKSYSHDSVALTLIQPMLAMEPKNRPTIEEVQSNDFFKINLV